MAEKLGTCVARVIPGGSYGVFNAYNCGNAGKVVGPDGKPYCGVHDQAKVVARREASSRRYEAERAADERRYAMQKLRSVALDLVRQIDAALPATLDLDGYSIPHALAVEARRLATDAKTTGEEG